MNNVASIFAKLAALYKELEGRLEGLESHRYLSNDLIEYYPRYATLRDQLTTAIPDLYSDLPDREFPNADEEGYFAYYQISPLLRDMAYIFEVKANSELKFDIWEPKSLFQKSDQRVFS